MAVGSPPISPLPIIPLHSPEMSTGAASPRLIRRVFRIVSPTCEDMTGLISAMQDRELPRWTRLRMQLHFLYCRYCRRVREQFDFVRQTCARLDSGGPEERLAAEDKEKLRRALNRRP